MTARRALLLLCLAAAALVPAAQATLTDAAGALAPDGLPTDAAADAGVADVQADAEVNAGDATVSASTEDGVSVAASSGGPSLDVTAPAVADGVLSPSSFGKQVAPYAVPVAGSALVVVAGALAWRALSALVPAAVPLFSRIERDRLLDNPVRARVHEAVAQEPGLSLSDVAARAGIAWGTAVHHLSRLESNGLLVSTSRGGHRRFFVANTPAAAQRSAVAVVLHPTARRIAELVARRPGIDQSGICQALDLNNPAASKHLGRFEAQGLVLSQRSGRSRHYHPTGGLRSALVLLDEQAQGGRPLVAAV